MVKYGCCLAAIVLLLTAGTTAYSLARGEVPVTARIPGMIILELDANELVFDEVDFDYILGNAVRTETGVVATKKKAVTATVSGNIPYILLISAPEEFFYGQTGGLIHVSQLRWRLPSAYDGQAWEGITIERRSVKQGGVGVAEIPFDFQFIAFWENPAQIYTGGILLTVVPDCP